VKISNLSAAVMVAMLMGSPLYARSGDDTGKVAKTGSTKTLKNSEFKSKESDWTFNGQTVFYYQTADAQGKGSIFDQGPTSANSGWAKAAAGFQLSATNTDLGNGFGAGFEVSGLSSLGLEKHVVSGLVQNAGGTSDGFTAATVSKGYLTYALNNTNIKIGRQYLPKSLSPFAFSEGWTVFKNSFDAALFVNSDIKDTTLVYAYVTRRNNSVGNLNDYNRFFGSDVAHMITAQNTSFDGVTLTGSFYSLPDATVDGTATALWFDAIFKYDGVNVAFQTGSIGGDAVPDDNNAYGVKLSGKIGDFDTSFAYSSAGDGTLNIANLAGAGVKSPLYTQAILNQNTIKRDSDSVKVTAAMKALGGKFIVAYINSDLGVTALPSVFGTGVGGQGNYQEIEFIYKKSVGKHIKLFAAFINQNDDRQVDESQNFVRLWARYTF